MSAPFVGRPRGDQQFASSTSQVAIAIPFAGRLGGNQDFIASTHTSDSELREIIKKTPDAAPLGHFEDILDLRGFREPMVWKAAVIECWATSMLVFLAGLVGTSLGPYITPNSLQARLALGLSNWIVITLFVYAAAPASGGHLSPFITMSTFTSGLSTLPRSALYIIAQLIGALTGAFLLKLGLGGDNYFPSGTIGGCTIDTVKTSFGQVYILELSSYLAAIFLSFGVGLDPRQSQVFGPAYSPVLVGLTVGLVSFCTSFTNTGWSGASLNPARCFGLMAAKGDFRGHWIHWLAAITAAVINGLFYHFIPPYYKEKIQ